MSLVLAILGGTLAPVIDGRAARQIRAGYPTEALRGKKSGGALIELEVGPDGRIRSCRALAAIGDPALRLAACRAIQPIRLTAATDAGGAPAYGVLRTALKFFMPGTAQARSVELYEEPADLELSVLELPEGTGSRADVELVLDVDRDGRVRQCEGKPDTPSKLLATACGQVKALRRRTVEGEAGGTVPYMERFMVQFVTQP